MTIHSPAIRRPGQRRPAKPSVAAAAVRVAVFLGAAATIPCAGAAPPAIGPWLARHCGDCHAGGSQEGGVSLAGVAAFTDAKADVWGAVYEQLQLALMPPVDAEQPSPEERAAVLAWVADSLRAAGHHVPDKLSLPNYGNYVPHEPLFRGPADPAPATFVRAWRIRPEVYDKRAGGNQPFALLPGQQIRDFSSLYEVDESSAEVVLGNAETVVEKLMAGQFKRLVESQAEPAAADVDAAVRQAFETAMGRGPKPTEADNARRLYAKALAANGRERAVWAALIYPFLQAEAYYRLELGAGEPDAHGRRRLSKEGIVAAIQQTLAGTEVPPSLQAVLRDEQATLATRDEVAAVVRRLLDAEPPGAVNARVLVFFDEYFDYRKATDVAKTVPIPLGSSYNAPALVKETARLIQRIVAEDRDVIRRLLTTREAFIQNAPGTLISTGAVYNLPPDFPGDGLVTFDPSARCGILTQPAWLVAHSGNFDTDPVRRGKWVLEHLLGGTVPDVPVTVCAKVPDEPTQTLRERFRVVSDDSYCWKCHARMNPLGMSFEMYDQFGRQRLRELDREVDSSGAVADSGVSAVDGPVKDAVELIERLAESKRAEEVFVRYAFRFFLGRNETLRDAKTLREAHEAYVTSQGSVKSLVTSLLSSDSFLYRVAAGPTPGGDSRGR